MRTHGRAAFIFPLPNEDVLGKVDFELTLANPVDVDGALVQYHLMSGVTSTFNPNFWKIKNGLNSGIHKQTPAGTFSTGGAFKVLVGDIDEDGTLLQVGP
jgi:hypothetical protein